jgi:molybdenum cofactor synthesis domain-containing protein
MTTVSQGETAARAGTRAGAADRVYSAAVIIIGNEILSGRTRDANLPFLAEHLNRIGVRLLEARVVADVPVAIVEAVNACRRSYDYVFTTGGIGPTHDDITSASVAEAFGVPLVLDPDAVALLRRHYEAGQLNEARLRMAHVPEGARLIDNPVSLAPGFQIGNVFVMAGVPSIMQAMFEGVKHRLTGGKPMLARAIAGFIGEGVIAKGLSELQARHPTAEIGSYPFFRQGRYGASFVIRTTEAAILERAAEELKDLIRSLGAEPIEE